MVDLHTGEAFIDLRSDCPFFIGSVNKIFSLRISMERHRPGSAIPHTRLHGAGFACISLSGIPSSCRFLAKAKPRR